MDFYSHWPGKDLACRMTGKRPAANMNFTIHYDTKER